MRFLNGQNYVEVEDPRYRIHPTEDIILGERDPPKSLRTQVQNQNTTQMRKNQKNIENNGKLEVKNSPEKKQPLIQQQPNFKPPNCPSCKQNIWLKIDKGYYCRNCEYIFMKQKHQIDKKVRRQDHDLSTRLTNAIKKIRENLMNINTT